MIKVIIFNLFFCLSAHASFNDFSFGAGLFNRDIAQYQTSIEGETNKFEHQLFLEAEASYSLSQDYSLMASAGLLWPDQSDSDILTETSFFFNAHLNYHYLEDLSFRIGTGLYFTSLSGSGGTVSLPNGGSNQFDAFPAPDGTSTSINATFILGSRFYFATDYSIKLEALIFNPLNSRNRTFSYALSGHFHFRDFI